MRFLKAYWGILLVPALALAYGAYALWELTTGSFQNATIIYTYVIAVPMLILGAVALTGDLKKSVDSGEAIKGTPSGKEEQGTARGGARRVALVVVFSLGLIVALPYVGYLIGFLLYVPAVLWAIELRNWKAGAIIAVFMAAMVHFVFVGLLGQDLPVGILTFMAD